MDSSLTFIALPREILILIISYRLNEIDRSGWKIVLVCKYLLQLSESLKSIWYNPVSALRHAAHHNQYDIIKAMNPSVIHSISSSDKSLIMKCAVSGNNPKILEILQTDPFAIPFYNDIHLQTALKHGSNKALECIRDYTKYHHNRLNTVDKLESRDYLYDIANICIHLDTHWITSNSLDTFKLFWEIASLSFHNGNDILASEQEEFVYQLLKTTCKHGLVDIAEFITENCDIASKLHPSFIYVALCNGRYNMLKWIHDKYKPDDIRIHIPSDLLIDFLHTWQLAEENGSLKLSTHSYYNCLELILSDPEFFHLEKFNDAILFRLLMIQDPRKQSLYHTLRKGCKKHVRRSKRVE